MNLNGDEKRIRRLFREISLEDMRQTPEFDRVLEGASSRAARGQDRVRPLRFAMVVATLIIVVLMAVWSLRQKHEGAGPKPTERAGFAPEPPPAPQIVPPEPHVSRPSVGPRVVKRNRHRRPANELVIDTKSLFAWQSPTASLLKSTTQDLLMSLPRLGESLEAIKSFSPDLWN